MRIKEAAEFLKRIDGKVLVCSHNDCDGACSAALMLACLRQLKKDVEVFNGSMVRGTVELVLGKEFDYIIFLDLNADQFYDLLKPLEKSKVMIIDHHTVFNDLNKKGIVHINPRIEDPKAYISASQLVFDVCREAGLENMEWVSRIGAVGDHALEGNEQEKEGSEIMFAIEAVKGNSGMLSATKFLATADKIEDLLYKNEYRDCLETFNKEIENQLRRFESQNTGEVVFFEVKSNYGVSGAVANKLLELYPEKTIIHYKLKYGYYGFGGRSHKYDMAKLFRKAVEGMGEAGGHPIAAGGNFKGKNFETFRRKILELIKDKSFLQ